MSNETSTHVDTPELEEAIKKLMAQGNAAFEEACRTRHEKGQLEYGETTYLGAPTIEMAMEEAADLSNYARYTYIKAYILQQHMKMVESMYENKQQQTHSHGFVPLSQINLGG